MAADRCSEKLSALHAREPTKDRSIPIYKCIYHGVSVIKRFAVNAVFFGEAAEPSNSEELRCSKVIPK